MIEYKTLSLADQVYDRLEQGILSGVYPVGEVLSEKRLAAELGVSRTPIREALSRLSYDNLIKDTPQGSEVLGISKDDVEDMFLVKKKLEVIATVRAAVNMGEAELSALQAVLDQQEYYSGKGDARKVRDLDTEFHDLIYAGSGSSTLQSILSASHHKLMKFRRVSLENEDRIMASVAEHRAIFEAMKSGDKKSVEDLMKAHIENAYDSIMGGM